MKFLVLLSLIGLAASQAHYELLEEWNLWKEQHGRSYASEREELKRHIVWLSNKRYIEQHNANAHIFGFTLAMNHFGDMTDAEFNKLYLTSRRSTGNHTDVKVHVADPSVGYYPDSIDWRTKGAVSSVKHQDQCGSSYAFSAVGALEGAQALATGKMTTLSEQNIVDCSVPYGNLGCNGGNVYDAFLYIIANEGVDTSSNYPYKGRQNSCSFSENYVGASMSGSVAVRSGCETSLLSAVANVGPVSVTVDGSSNAFRYYAAGVYDASWCSSSSVNHAMLVTGYGTYGGYKKYWLVKNSWGSNWGMNGYILMSRNKYNQCGIATDALYPTM